MPLTCNLFQSASIIPSLATKLLNISLPTANKLPPSQAILRLLGCSAQKLLRSTTDSWLCNWLVLFFQQCFLSSHSLAANLEHGILLSPPTHLKHHPPPFIPFVLLYFSDLFHSNRSSISSSCRNISFPFLITSCTASPQHWFLLCEIRRGPSGSINNSQSWLGHRCEQKGQGKPFHRGHL